jgi:hypothetical protein
MTNDEILAAWLIHVSRVGPEGRLLPTERETVAIVNERPDRFEEAHAFAVAFVEKVKATEPKGIVEATHGFLKEVHRVQEKVGGFLNAEPAGALIARRK